MSKLFCCLQLSFFSLGSNLGFGWRANSRETKIDGFPLKNILLCFGQVSRFQMLNCYFLHHCTCWNIKKSAVLYVDKSENVLPRNKRGPIS